MILNKLTCNVTAPVNDVKEEVSEVLQEETTQVPHQDETQDDLIIDDRELQLLTLFGAKRIQPSKRKDKVQLVESVFDILIPRSTKSSRKGRIQRDDHKRSHVTQLINNSNDKEQLTRDLITWIDDFAIKASKRK